MTKKKNIDVVYSNSFEKQADDLIGYLSLYKSEIDSISKLETVISNFEIKVQNAPYSCQVSPILRDYLGISDFREYLNNGIRIVYRVLEDNDQITISADACVSQRQDIEKVIVNFCLTHR